MNRALVIADFLDRHGWGNADQEPFEADFSPRRYCRLTRNDGEPRNAILMDADADQKTPAFVAIAALLRKLDLSAPEIYAAEPQQGLALIEDFGSHNIGALLDGQLSSGERQAFYRRAAELLAHLHEAFKPEMAAGLALPVFDTARFAEQAELYLDAYLTLGDGQNVTDDARAAFRTAWLEVLRDVGAWPQSLLLRDFMPDNLMDLPERAGHRSLGILDFQDAGLGPTSYDLASLCETVRRDGGDAMQKLVIDAYRARLKAPPAANFARAVTILSAQRHMRVLGIVAGQVRRGREEKRSYFARIERRLDDLLQDPALQPVRDWRQRYNS